MTGSSPPTHLVLGSVRHGVNRLATELADALDAPVQREPTARPRADRIHVHLTDHLWGDCPEQAAQNLLATTVGARLTLTLHDVPQAGEGAAFAGRSAAYRALVARAAAVVVNSEHERSLLVEAGIDTDAFVIGLPVGWTPVRRPATPARDVALSGFIYPGKGHLDVLAALDGLPGDIGLRALGAVSPGHAWLARQLQDDAARRGRRLSITGYLDDADWLAELQRPLVPVAAHRHVSASGSIGSWIAAGRRPLVVDSRYARELEALSPHSLWRYAAEDLPETLARALHDPASTWAAARHRLPDLAHAASRYRRLWAEL